MKASDRYLKIVQWSDEDQCYVGTCPAMMLGGVHGGDEAAVYVELCEVVEEWIRIHEEDGDPLPEPTVGEASSQGKALRFDDRYLHVELRDGRMVSTPMAWYPALQEASWKQLADYRLTEEGSRIEWPELDFRLNVESMVLGLHQQVA